MRGRAFGAFVLSCALVCGLCPASAWGYEASADRAKVAESDVAAVASVVQRTGHGEALSADDATVPLEEDSSDASDITVDVSAETSEIGETDEDGMPSSGTLEGSEVVPPAGEEGTNAAEDAESESGERAAKDAEGADNPDDEDSEEGEGEEGVEPVLPDGAYFVRSAADPSFVLDVADASVVSGADVRLWSANESNAQRFWVSSEDGVYRLQAMCSGKALAVEEGGLENDADVQQWLLEEASVEQTWEASENDDGTFTLVSCANDLALDMADGLAFEGADVRTWEQNGTVAQRFVFEPAEAFRDGVYTIPSTIDMGMVVDVPDLSRDAGVSTHLWERNDGFAQKFVIEATGEGDFTFSPICSGLLLTDIGGQVVQAEGTGDASRWWIIPGVYGVSFLNVATGLALDVSGGVAENARPVGTYAINGTRAQGFFGMPVEAVSPGTYRVTCVSDGRALDVSGASFAQGTNVQAWVDNGTGAQRWRVKSAGEGIITLQCARSNMALDVVDYGTAPGTNVQVWLPTGTTAQQFVPIPTGDGYFYLQSVCNGLYLDVANGGGWDGANVQVWTPNETAAQKFSFTLASYERTMDEVRAGINAAGSSWGIAGFGGYTPSAQVAGQLQAAVDYVRAWGNDVGFVMVDVQTGQGVSCNADGSFYAASTIKGPYVASVCSYYPWAATDWAYTMESTIRWSSNEGYSSLRYTFGPQPLWQWCTWSGVSADIASLQYPWYSSRDLVKLWTTNYEYFTGNPNGGWVGSWYSSALNSPLYYQLGGLYSVQSKAGWIAEGGLSASNDAGIVWANNGPYLVAILSSFPSNTARLSDLVWALEAAHNEMVATY